MGEIYIARKNYEQAGIYFSKSYKKLPGSTKAAEALYRLAVSLSNLNKVSEACKIVKKIYKDHTSIDEKLKNKIKEQETKLGCK